MIVQDHLTWLLLLNRKKIKVFYVNQLILIADELQSFLDLNLLALFIHFLHRILILFMYRNTVFYEDVCIFVHV